MKSIVYVIQRHDGFVNKGWRKALSLRTAHHFLDEQTAQKALDKKFPKLPGRYGNDVISTWKVIPVEVTYAIVGE